VTALVAIAGLALAAAAFVLAPLFRADAREAERVSRAMSEEQDLGARHAMALSALRDLEEDRGTGKIGDADYEAMKAKLSAQAIELMKALDAIAARRS
jgi:hypothetical protein